MEILVEKRGPVCTVIINRPQARNAVDGRTARLLHDAFRAFDTDDDLRVAVLWGAGGTFCAGADLKAVSGSPADANPLEQDMSKPAPMGPSRLFLSKPVIAAVAGHAVAGGLELACWCDLRIVEDDAIFVASSVVASVPPSSAAARSACRGGRRRAGRRNGSRRTRRR